MEFRRNALCRIFVCISAALAPLGSVAQDPIADSLRGVMEQHEAVLNASSPGQPVFQNDFRATPDAGASRDFIAAYAELSAFLESGDVVRATSAFDQLQTQRSVNAYEASFLRLARRALLDLQIRKNYLREAMSTYAELQNEGDVEAVAAFASAMAQITELADNTVAYSAAALLDANGAWSIALHKRQFYIDEVSGKVVAAELVCAEQSQTLAVEVLFGYTLPAALGDCTAIFTGEPGTTFVLTQYRD